MSDLKSVNQTHASIAVDVEEELQNASSMGYQDTKLKINTIDQSSNVETKSLRVSDGDSKRPSITITDTNPAKSISNFHRYFLLVVFCLAYFLDGYMNSSLFSALPSLITTLGMTTAESAWPISAYQATLSAFLLIGGRISDVYGPKIVFVVGCSAVAILSIGTGFSQNAIVLIILRALVGVAAALTIPSTMSLIVVLFPEPDERARAISLISILAIAGNVFGLIIGAILTQYSSWRWAFWFSALLATPSALAALLFVPSDISLRKKNVSGLKKLQSIDIVGVIIVTTAILLFIFAVTNGSNSGWDTATVIIPLVISILLMPIFLFWESKIPFEMAAIPPKTWTYPNFKVVFLVDLIPLMWSTVAFTIFTTNWQQQYHWSVLSTAVHLLPIGVTMLIALFTAVPLCKRFDLKYSFLFGIGIRVISTILLIFADRPERYWSIVFPAFVLGSLGMPFIYLQANIAAFASTPPSMAGTVSAIMNASNLFGSSLALAIAISIQGSVNSKNPGNPYAGATAAFGFSTAILGTAGICVLLFFKREPADLKKNDAISGDVQLQNLDVKAPVDIKTSADVSHSTEDSNV